MTGTALFALALAVFGLLTGYLFTFYQNQVFQIYLETWGLC